MMARPKLETVDWTVVVAGAALAAAVAYVDLGNDAPASVADQFAPEVPAAIEADGSACQLACQKRS